MPHEAAAAPDLRPWDRELAQRVQPVLSALFHDIMSPLTLMKNRLFLIRRQLEHVEHDAALPAELRVRVAAIGQLLTALEDATNRIHRGMTVPRDAIWETLLEGTLFDPSTIIDQIGAAMRSSDGQTPPPLDPVARLKHA